MEDASSQLSHLLKITSVAGVFVCLTFGVVSAIWFMLGTEHIEVLALAWGSLFLGVPMFGGLFSLIRVQEYLHDLRAGFEKSG